MNKFKVIEIPIEQKELCMNKFKVIEIPIEQKDFLEQLGTKEKFWFNDGKLKKLFKIGRPNTGEDWVEVVVSRICNLLEIPHAKYEFAIFGDKKGTITTNIVPNNARLVHGNELLARVFKEYEKDTFYKVKKHKIFTISLIMKALEESSLKLDFNTKKYKDFINTDEYKYFSYTFFIFIGYIVLDCLISNQDRHHENWGIVVCDKKFFLAPTYDHASGLGSKESDENKEKRLKTKDKNFSVEAFINRAITPFYDNEGNNLKTIDSIKACAKIDKNSTLFWLNKVDKLNIDDVSKIFQRIPKGLISKTSIQFAIEIIKENKKRLVKYKKELENE